MISFARQTLADFKVLKIVIFQELPKKLAEKIQKFELGTIAKNL